jgi:hypothetical protein
MNLSPAQQDKVSNITWFENVWRLLLLIQAAAHAQGIAGSPSHMPFNTLQNVSERLKA